MRDSFDFVIVGGGTAGCVLAGRLLELRAGSVAIVEQGGEPRGPRIYRPALYPSLFGSRWDEGLETVPQANLRSRRLNWPRGKMLGGSSGMNAMIYSRGNPADFEAWPEDWSYEKNLKAFCTVEQRIFNEPGNDDSGSSTLAPSIHLLSERFLAAAEQFGLPRRSHGSIEAVVGGCQYRRTARKGRRLTTYDLFLKAKIENEDLSVFPNFTAERILMKNDQAVGVVGTDRHGRSEIRASKAVILSIGSVRSPALLLRSGIGPAEDLKDIDVEVRIELDDVGRNLQDHLVYPIIYSTSEDMAIEKEFSRTSRLQYVESRDGAIASNLAEVGAFLSLDGSGDASSARPDVQLHFTPNHYLEYPIREKPKPAWSIGVTLLHPKSRGAVRCQRGDSNEVLIDPSCLSDPSDIARTIEAVRKAEGIARQTALQSVAGPELLPGKYGTSDFRLESSIRAYSTTIFHPVGTCSMPTSTSAGVVDENLLVRGTRNLFVADASVIPNLPSANPQAVVMMLGYRTAGYLSRIL